MNSNVMIVFFLFVFVLHCAASLPPSHEFRARTHEGSKTIVQDGVKKKISVVRVFWSLVEGDYVYGKKRIIDDIDPDPHGTGIIQLHNSYNSGEECELALERSYFEDEVEEEVIELTFEDNLCV